MRENLNFYIKSNLIAYDVYEPCNNNYADKAYNKLIKQNKHPNYISVNVWGTETYNDAYIKFLDIILAKENVDKKLNIDTYKSVNYNGIKELKEEIN